MPNQFDVVILGGGLAGLTLSLQLKKANKDISILILEQRKEAAPTAGHKVGESTVELGTHYLREVLGLRDYLDKHQLPKHGLRFFFSPEYKDQIEKRVELGPRERLPLPSHQIDRGTFENDLIDMSREAGCEIQLGARVKEVQINDELHAVGYKQSGQDLQVNSKWVVDATGRGSFLKRKMGFEKPMEHNINAAWFRVEGEIDVDHWSQDTEWNSYLDPGLRRLGTVHLMDTGYWVWLIPLATGNTSVGIVADPRFHPFEEFNTLEKAKTWIAEHEPQASKEIFTPDRKIIDFLFLKHYSHHSGQLYSSDRWAVTGEAGPFLDPFYSPGTDFIGLANTWVASLITRDLADEDIFIHARVYEQTHLGIVDNWVPVYLDKYQLMGHSQIMVVKIFWDWAVYWSFFTLLFTNNAYTDLTVLKQLFGSEDSIGQRLKTLSDNMQKLFIDWVKYDKEEFHSRYVDPFDLKCLREFHKNMEIKHERNELISVVENNLEILEQLASQIFVNVSYLVNNTSDSISVDPYTMDLTMPESINANGPEIPVQIQEDVAAMWFYEKETVS